MSKASKIILGIVALLFISVFAKFTYKDIHDEFFRSQECWAERNAKESQFYGKVIEKFVDSKNHSANAITLEYKNNVGHVWFSDNEESALYDTIEVNDSIRKDANSLRFYLKRNKSNRTDTILVKYNCK